MRCPECGGPPDNGHDREDPPNVYACSRCEPEPTEAPLPPEQRFSGEADALALVRDGEMIHVTPRLSREQKRALRRLKQGKRQFRPLKVVHEGAAYLIHADCSVYQETDTPKRHRLLVRVLDVDVACAVLEAARTQQKGAE
jgi:hypothetical protein